MDGIQETKRSSLVDNILSDQEASIKGLREVIANLKSRLSSIIEIIEDSPKDIREDSLSQPTQKQPSNKIHSVIGTNNEKIRRMQLEIEEIISDLTI